MTMMNEIPRDTPHPNADSCARCTDDARVVVQYATSFRLGRWWLVGPGAEATWECDKLDDLNRRPNRVWDWIAREETLFSRESGHPVFTATSVRSKKIRCTGQETKPVFTSLLRVKTFKYLRKSLNRAISCAHSLELLHDWSMKRTFADGQPCCSHCTLSEWRQRAACGPWWQVAEDGRT